MLDYYREFVVLAMRLNFSSAALELNMSQPSLSRHIAELEREVGFKLLNRKPVSLTPAGKLFLESANEAFGILDRAIERSRAVSKEEANSIAVSLILADDYLSNILYSALAQMKEHNPLLSLRVVSDKTKSVFDMVTHGEADVGMLPYEPSGIPEGLVCEWLLDNRFDAWTHKDSPLVLKKSVRFEDLANYYLVESTNRMFESWTEAQKRIFKSRGIEPKVRLKALDSLNDFALSVKPDEILIADSQNRDPSTRCNPDFVQLHLSDPSFIWSNYLLYRDDPDKPLVKEFVALCHQIAQKQGAENCEEQTE